MTGPRSRQGQTGGPQVKADFPWAFSGVTVTSGSDVGVGGAQSGLLGWGSAVGAEQPLAAQGGAIGPQGLHPADLQGRPLPPSVSSPTSSGLCSVSQSRLCLSVGTRVMAFRAQPDNPGSSPHFEILHLVTPFATQVLFSEARNEEAQASLGHFSLTHS